MSDTDFDELFGTVIDGVLESIRQRKRESQRNINFFERIWIRMLAWFVVLLPLILLIVGGMVGAVFFVLQFMGVLL